jgi:hypothetical protein
VTPMLVAVPGHLTLPKGVLQELKLNQRKLSLLLLSVPCRCLSWAVLLGHMLSSHRPPHELRPELTKNYCA